MKHVKILQCILNRAVFRHHALKARASGFCYVADCVLAIMALRKPMTMQPSGVVFRPRIMYLDLDLHFSDGVSSAFASQSTSNARVLVS
jgi:histone deacetylase 8